MTKSRSNPSKSTTPSTRRRSSKRRSTRKEPLIQLSRDQWLDLLGGGLILVAVATILSLLSPQQGALTQLWLTGLKKVFGWGMFIVPLFIGALGVWLILRRFGDRLPRPQPEQVAGVGIGFLTALMTLHLIASRIFWPGVGLFQLVEQGEGGGLIGAALLDLSIKLIGVAGAVVALLMLWLIVITLVVGISPAEAAQILLEGRAQSKRQAPAAEQLSLPTLPPEEPPPAGGSRSTVKAPAPKPSPVVLGGEAPTHGGQGKSSLKINGTRPEEEHIDFKIPPTPSGSPWRLPAMAEILEVGSEQSFSDDLIRKQARIIEDTLTSLGAPVKVLETNTGPVVVQFGVEPLFIDLRGGKRTKVKVSKIASLADDLALALSARSIRIEAPIPGKGLVGIEVPNIEPSVVALRDVLESRAFAKLKGSLRMGLGQDVSGQAVAADLRVMPHLLIAGTTGSGKSVCVNAIIAALILQNTPETLRMMMVDPKRVELTQYNGIPHLLTPVIVDVDRVVPALRWVMREMDTRYRRFAKVGARNIEDFNRRAGKKGSEDEAIPYIVVIVDELADLMMQSPEETERVLCRLAQMARATGIHLIVATQRPSVNVVTGLIKANFPARIAFAVASSVDSRVILDMPGAERLLGRGDMLFMPPDAGQPLRLQGTFVSDRELDRLIQHWRQGNEATVVTMPPAPSPLPLKDTPPIPEQEPLFPEFAEPAPQFEDELLPTAVEILLAEDRASISLLQRRMRIGYTRSARLVDLMTDLGIVTPNADQGQFRGVNRAVAEAFLRSLTQGTDENNSEAEA
ncbi:MAG: DNA translocase FtsK 4TM domain-containing protein [Anaerolineae bacterium]|nr:DNA translocase FtsK 4TM domain-containing protein [Anaerolineae bacterium]